MLYRENGPANARSSAGYGGRRMKGHGRNRLWDGAALALLAIAPLLLGAGSSARAAVKWLAPGEELIQDPQLRIVIPKDEEPSQDQKSRLEKVRIAVPDGDDTLLAGLVAGKAPFEIVGPSAHPDLMWDPASHNVSSGSAVVAYRVDIANLPAVIDRTAVVRALTQLATLRPQSIKLASPNGLIHKGDKIQIVVDDVAGRALLVIDIAGDGVAQISYPIGADQRIVKSSPYELPPVRMGAPFGTDVFLAITAAKPIEALDQRMRDTPALNATELLALIDENLPQDAHLGLVNVTSAP
ncbi:MAG: hypothetical protein ACLPID_17530 [Beijerinckiaceae bacterium]